MTNNRAILLLEHRRGFSRHCCRCCSLCHYIVHRLHTHDWVCSYPKSVCAAKLELFPMGLEIIDTVTQPLRNIDNSMPRIIRRITLRMDYFPNLDGTGCLLIAFLEKAMPVN